MDKHLLLKMSIKGDQQQEYFIIAMLIEGLFFKKKTKAKSRRLELKPFVFARSLFVIR